LVYNTTEVSKVTVVGRLNCIICASYQQRRKILNEVLSGNDFGLCKEQGRI